MKIQYQLWLTFSVLFILISASVYMVVSNTYEQNLQAGYEQVSITQGLSILEQFRDTYPHSPHRTLGYLEAYSERLDSRLIILNEDKSVYADSFQQLQADTSVDLEILRQGSSARSLFAYTEPYGYIQYTLIPFESVGGKGYLLMVQLSETLHVELKQFDNWMLRVLFVAVLAFFLISYLVSSWFSKPIRDIIYHLRRITPSKRVFNFEYQRDDEIKELVDTTKNMVKELNVYDERQRRFLSSSSHELKTPLATMQLILENLPYVREDQESYEEFVQDLSFQVKKMRQMVEQLLQINRVWDKKLQKENIHGEEIEGYITHSFYHISKAKKIELRFVVEPIKLKVDWDLFLCGLENLVSNAIRYSPVGGEVEICIKKIYGKVIISVCDKGIGISPENIPHIFEPFYRSNDATAWNQEGTGLGLTIVKQMVGMHGGDIDVKSETKEGTCIHLKLPVM